MMHGLMQDCPLTIDTLFRHAERHHRHATITSNSSLGRSRTTYTEWADRTRRLGGVLDALGVTVGGRVGTFAWNSQRHLELYFAVPCAGRILHTLNIRLFPEQLAYIVNHAEDEVVFVDRSLLSLFWPLLHTMRTVRAVIVMDDDGSSAIPDDPRVHHYEELLADSSPIEFDVKDERQAASMCYTSGTTGNPKGVVYTHRSTFLHTMATLSANAFGLDINDVAMPVVPMFHANAWGIAHAAPAAGASLVFTGSEMNPESIAQLMLDEEVTVAAAVPTIWQTCLPFLADSRKNRIRKIIAGGSAVPSSLSESYRRDVGIPITQAWGMTETHPLASIVLVPSNLDPQLAVDRRSRAGTPLLGIEARIADAELLEEMPWDDTSTGELQVRGPWCAADYYRPEAVGALTTEDGWMRTGDVAAMDENGALRLVDRTKDLIKSGGEWISSVDLENAIMSHPSVQEAAVIAISHPKWDERPLACVVLKPGAAATQEDILDHIRPMVAKWWLPDAVEFIGSIPKTSVGKFSKKDLRARFACLPDQEQTERTQH